MSEIHKIIGGLSFLGIVLCVLMLIWTNLDWRILIKLIVTFIVVITLCNLWGDAIEKTKDNE